MQNSNDTSPKEPTTAQLFDLTGKVAMVTGGTGYLGHFMARALAEAGATVVVTCIDAESARATADGLPDPNGTGHHSAVLDHMDEARIRQCFDETLQKAFKVDVLVNNGHEPLASDWTTVTGEQFTRQLANATGYFLLARLVHGDAVRHKRPASIIMLGSMYGMVASYPRAYEDIGPANPVAYQAMKAGVIQMARHLGVYWARDRVRVNCISPGPFPPPSADRKLVQRLEEHVPMRRMGLPHELKGAVVFLASDASSYVTGQNLVIDGGWTAQ